MGTPTEEVRRLLASAKATSDRQTLERIELVYEIADARDHANRLGLGFIAYLLEQALLESINELKG